MQAGPRLVRDEVQREPLRAWPAQPLVGLEPARVAGAVVVAETVDVGGEDLDPPARGGERVALRVVAEIGEQRKPVLGAHPHEPTTPELVERRRLHVRRVREHEATPLLVQMLDPLLRGAALGEPLTESQSMRERRERVVVVAGIGVPGHRRVHRDQQRIVAGAGEIVAFERGGRRDHDVGVPGHRRPVRLVYDDRVRPGQRAAQPGEVLVVVERIAAGPVNEAGVREGEASAVEVELLARVQEQIRDRGHRNEVRHRIAALEECRQRIRHRGESGLVHRPVAVSESASGKPDLAEHRGECHSHPRRLLAVPHPLQRPRDRQHRPARGHPACQRPDLLGGHPGQRRRPLRRLRDAVVDTEQVALEPVVADAVPREEILVVQAFRREHMGEAQHDRDIGSGHRCDPVAPAVQVVPQRADRHHLGAAIPQPVEGTAGRMFAGATAIDGRVLERHATEAHHQIGVGGDDVPIGGAGEQLPVRAHHARHDDAGRTEGIGVYRAGVAAEHVEEPVHLALRVVETAGAGPAVGTAEDRPVAVPFDDATQFARQQFRQLVPRHGHELVGAADLGRAGTRLEPAPPDRRPGDAGAVPHRPGQVAEDRGRIGVPRIRVHGAHVTVGGLDIEHAPVRHVLVPRRRTHGPQYVSGNKGTRKTPYFVVRHHTAPNATTPRTCPVRGVLSSDQGSELTSCSTLTRGPVKNGVSSRTCMRASVARRSRMRSTMRSSFGASNARIHS